MSVIQQVVSVSRRVCKQINLHGTIPEPMSHPRIWPGGDHQVHVLETTEKPWQLLRSLGSKTLVQRVDQYNDLGGVTRLAQPFEGLRHCLPEGCLRLEPAQIDANGGC